MNTSYPRYTLLPLCFAAITLVLRSSPPVQAALPLQPEQIVVTCFSGTINYYDSPPFATPNLGANGYVVAQFDTQTGTIGPLIPSLASPPYRWSAASIPPINGFHNETGQPWNAQRLGEVFGICVDDAASPNIYVTATECYNVVGAVPQLPKGPGGAGGVYRLDGTTGASTFGSLPNNSVNGPGLGNVCFRRAGTGTGYLYVSNLEDGYIYRMNAATLTVVGAPFDHGVQGRTSAGLSPILPDNGTPGLTQYGRRVWGVKTFESRLYYAVWWEDSRNISLTESNEIWSVNLDNNGNFLFGTAQRLFSLPNFSIYPWSHPAASIDFSPTGKMFLAERYWQYLTLVPLPVFGAHNTRILRYWLTGPNWVTDPGTTHHVGGDPSVYFTNNMPGANSAGGVAVNCDESVWGTGDMYAGSYSSPPNIPFGPGDLGYVYGALRIPTGGNSALAGFGYGSLAIDYDGNINTIAKFGIGAIATVKDCCVPPPTGMAAWWPLDELTGATTYADLSGNGNTALIESGGPLGNFLSPAAGPGQVAGASTFLDSSSRGRAPNAPSLNFGTNSFSLDGWVRPAGGLPNSWQTIVDKLDLGTLRGYTVGISNGNLALRVGDGTLYTHTGQALSPNSWNFVAVLVNRSANSVQFYANGTLTAQQTLIPTGSFDNTVDLLIGAPYTTNIISETALDEIELFNRVLTTNELSALWLAGSLGKCKTGQPPCTNSVVSIVCPTNRTVACAPIVYYPPPQASTTCGIITNLTCVPPSGSVFPVGPTVVTCTAFDSLGNSNTCNFTINVTPDVNPPVIDCACLTNTFHEQLDVLGCEGVVPALCGMYSRCFSDDCCLASCSQSPPAGTPVGPGVTPITFTLTDCAGNSNSCVVQMTVTPPPGGCGTNTDCRVICPTNITVTTCGSDAVVFYPTPLLSSNCPPSAMLLCSPPSGSTFPLGTNTVTCVILDGLGGVIDSCHFTVTVLPATQPWDIICPNPAISINVTGCPPVMPNLANLVTIITNCPPACQVSVTQSIPAGLPLTAGIHVAIVTACDCLMNCKFCDVTINAVATTGNPVITCPPNQVITTCGTNAVAKYKVTASNYTGVLTCNPPSGSTFPLGTTWVTCTATNACGGIATCYFSVTVKKPNPRWPCDWQVGIGIPYEPVGGATMALKAVGPGGPGYPAVCVFPNPGNPLSGARLHLGQAQAFSFTTELDFTAPVGAGMDLVLPPGPLHGNGTPLLSFRSKGTNGYSVKMNQRTPDDPAGLFRTIAVNTNGHLLDSFTFNSHEALTNDTLMIGFQPGVTNCHVTVELNCVDGSLSIEFTGPVVASRSRKGWDGHIYGPDRPVKKPTSKVHLIPPPVPGAPLITELYLYASGVAEVGIQEPTLTARKRKWSDGHVTLLKAYDDGQGMEFHVLGNAGSPVQVDLGHAESFDLRLTKFETNTLPGEELLTRTLGSIPGLPTPPPYLDALLLRENSGNVECSADFSNLGSPTVLVQVFSNSVIVAERVGVTGVLGQPLLILPTWPDRLGKLGGPTPCRRGKIPPGFITLPGNSSGVPPEIVTGDEFRILAELNPAAPQPDFYSGFEFIGSEGADWGVTELVRTTICVPQPVAIARVAGGATVSWTGGLFRLQGAEQVMGPWYDLGAASPVTVPASSAARYFRLVCD